MSRLDSIRAAVEKGKALAAEFHTGTMNIYVDGNTTPVFKDVPCRIKKPKPSSFDAGNQTEAATKRIVVAKIPQDLTPYLAHLPLDRRLAVIEYGLIAQVSTPDGDPTLNSINFTVQSALNSQFSAEREVTLATEIRETRRIA